MNQQTLVEDIDLNLADGMPVYGSNGDKVGDVKMYSTTAGYLMVGHGVFDQKDLYVPFRLIRSIDSHDLFLSESKETLVASYTQPPQISTLSEQRLVVGPGGALTSEQRDVQMVQSGYDGLPATTNSVDVQDVTDRKRAEVELRQSEERFRRLSEITFEAVLILQGGRIRHRLVYHIEALGHSYKESGQRTAILCTREGPCCLCAE
jgi:PAS domain-containing protein